jgi:peptidoglycan/xylan/chitin deacetylase (PgdA/CDA1 family)
MRILIKIAWALFTYTGLARLALRLNRRKVLVLVYHDVYGGEEEPLLNFDGMHVGVRRFARQMRYVSRRYRVVPLERLLDEFGAPRRDKPLAVVTFDDGYGNAYRYAYPVLRALNLPATIFPITQFIVDRRAPWWDRLRDMVAASQCSTLWLQGDNGRGESVPLETRTEKQAVLRVLAARLQQLPAERREEWLATLAASLGAKTREQPAWEPLRPAEVAEMSSHGISVGSHGASHESFLLLSQDALRRELTESKRILEALTGRVVSWLAYPYGDFSPATAKAVARAGYRGALTTIEGLNDRIDDPYAVRRVGVNDDMTMAQFVVASSGLRDMLKTLLKRILRSRAATAGCEPAAGGSYAVPRQE